jgi:DNA-binding response OmpR family regulator
VAKITKTLQIHRTSFKSNGYNSIMKILVIEDEANITQVIRLYLEQAGYTVVAASDGIAGIELHAREQPDLVILDLMLPLLDGMEVCHRIRNWANTPILMLTARQGEDDRIAGLEAGADDYLVKPFSPRELVSRVKAILRRSANTPGETHISSPSGEHSTAAHSKAANPDEIHFGGLTINIPARRVTVQGRQITLTVKEFDLLVALASAPDRVFTRESLLNQVWGYSYLGDGRTVDVHIGTLRKKLEAAPGVPHHIQTVWGVGYKFVPAPGTAAS